MRKKIVAGNWKMNLAWPEAKSLLLHVNSYISTHQPKCEVIVAPPFPYLDRAAEIFLAHAVVSAQNISQYEKGAYTGEISAEILKSIKVSSTLIGHSERRSLFGETNPIVQAKVQTAVKNNIQPILCCGETLEEREQGQAEAIVKEQLSIALEGVSKEAMEQVVLAYEPVWAIGTGKTASPAQAQEMHAYIRTLIAQLFDQEVADKVRILYGGSVKPSNAEELFSQADIDGGLIGGASLNDKDFTRLISIADQLS